MAAGVPASSLESRGGMPRFLPPAMAPCCELVSVSAPFHLDSSWAITPSLQAESGGPERVGLNQVQGSS